MLDPHYRVLRWTPEFRAQFCCAQNQDELAETRGLVLPDKRRIRTAQEVHRGARSTKALHQIRVEGCMPIPRRGQLGTTTTQFV